MMMFCDAFRGVLLNHEEAMVAAKTNSLVVIDIYHLSTVCGMALDEIYAFQQPWDVLIQLYPMQYEDLLDEIHRIPVSF